MLKCSPLRFRMISASSDNELDFFLSQMSKFSIYYGTEIVLNNFTDCFFVVSPVLFYI